MQVASWYNPTRARHVHLAYMRLRPNWERDQSRASAGLVLVGRSSITNPTCGKMGYRACYCQTLAQPTAWNESTIHGPLTCHSNSDTRRSPHPMCSTPLPFPSSYLSLTSTSSFKDCCQGLELKVPACVRYLVSSSFLQAFFPKTFATNACLRPEIDTSKLGGLR
jgi:hypothetical protein